MSAIDDQSYGIGDKQTGSTKVYVGGLMQTIGNDQLQEEFEKFGKVQKVWIARSPYSRGYAFVTFEEHEDAKMAVEGMDGEIFFGGKLRVELSNQGNVYQHKPSRQPYSSDRFGEKGNRKPIMSRNDADDHYRRYDRPTSYGRDRRRSNGINPYRTDRDSKYFLDSSSRRPSRTRSRSPRYRRREKSRSPPRFRSESRDRPTTEIDKETLSQIKEQVIRETLPQMCSVMFREMVALNDPIKLQSVIQNGHLSTSSMIKNPLNNILPSTTTFHPNRNLSWNTNKYNNNFENNTSFNAPTFIPAPMSSVSSMPRIPAANPNGTRNEFQSQFNATNFKQRNNASTTSFNRSQIPASQPLVRYPPNVNSARYQKPPIDTRPARQTFLNPEDL